MNKLITIMATLTVSLNCFAGGPGLTEYSVDTITLVNLVRSESVAECFNVAGNHITEIFQVSNIDGNRYFFTGTSKHYDPLFGEDTYAGEWKITVYEEKGSYRCEITLNNEG